MSKQVCAGATLICNQGTLPASLQVAPGRFVLVGNAAAANVADAVSLINIPLFGKCNVFSPAKPCAPATQRWKPGAAKVAVAGQAALTSACRLQCNVGGEIQIVSAGQDHVNLD
jgi:hypothetical protein